MKNVCKLNLISAALLSALAFTSARAADIPPSVSTPD
jgi:hypothetical protein